MVSLQYNAKGIMLLTKKSSSCMIKAVYKHCEELSWLIENRMSDLSHEQF